MNLQPSEWGTISAADGFTQISTTGKKVKTKDCTPTGKYPVVDQGQEKIGGYVDDLEKLISVAEPLIVFGDHTRAVKWVDFSFVPGADGTKILQVKPCLLPRFAYHQFRSLEIPNKGYSRHFKFLKELEFGVPPLSEQKVIADKLDTLLAQVASTKARLERIPQILKRFRQSVLAAAVNGRLTEKWREDRNISTGSWKLKRVDELSEKVVVGYVGPIKQYIADEGVPLLSTTHIQEKGFTWKERRFVSTEFSCRSQKSVVKPRDILVARHGDSGRCCLVPSDYAEYQTSNVVAIKTGAMALAEYVVMAMNAQKELVKEHQVGGVLKVVNTKSVAAHQLPAPTIEEQAEIVSRVDQLFAHADRIEQQANNALNSVNNLTQSILAKAFRGELTEKWRKDNPELISGENSAETLLQRIKAERSIAKHATRTNQIKASV